MLPYSQLITYSTLLEGALQDVYKVLRYTQAVVGMLHSALFAYDTSGAHNLIQVL